MLFFKGYNRVFVNNYVMNLISKCINPKGQMALFEFWSWSHFLSLHPNFLIILGLVLLFEIYLDMKIFSKIICRFEDIRV